MSYTEYSCSRLTFKACIIESLKENDVFCIKTPVGSFQMTKGDFYKSFPNVIQTKSYREQGVYSYTKTPQKANKYLFEQNETKNIGLKSKQTTPDLVGDNIRRKIKEIGQLWRSSEFNPKISKETLDYWNKIINDWVDAKDMPLIVRKDIKFRGQSFIHPTGREIIVSDNTFAIWVYGQVMKQHTPTLKEIKEMLQNNMIPMQFMRTKDGKQKAKYSKPLGTDALQGWKLCHIEPIGFNSSKSINEIDIHSIEEHFRKYANPYNMFVLPKEIGDLGEIQVFIDEQRRK